MLNIAILITFAIELQVVQIKIFKIMKINEIIEERMRYRGVNQTMICKECGISVQNYNSFIKGKRTISKENLFKVMNHLGLIFLQGDKRITPTEIEGELVKNIKNSGKKNVTLSQESGLSPSFLSKILSGKCEVSYKNLVKLLDYYHVTIVKE